MIIYRKNLSELQLYKVTKVWYDNLPDADVILLVKKLKIKRMPGINLKTYDCRFTSLTEKSQMSIIKYYKTKMK